MSADEPGTTGSAPPPDAQLAVTDEVVGVRIATDTKSDDVQLVAFDQGRLRKSMLLILGVLVVFSVGIWVFERIASFLFLLLIGWLFGVALEPIVGWLSRRGFKRGLATGIAMITFVLLVIAFAATFGGLLVAQLSQLIQEIPNLIDRAADWASATFERDIDPDAIAKQLNISTPQLTSWATNVAGGVFGVLATTVGLVFQMFTMLLFAFYFSADGPRLRRTIASWLPTGRQQVFVTIWDITVQKTGAFVVSRLVLALIAATFMSLFLLVLGVPFWLPLGLFSGIVSQFIPTVGTYLGILLPMLVAVFNDPMDAIWVAVFGTVYQQLENYLLAPKISAATLDIHPAVAFASVIVGASLGGAMGAIIAIPIAAAITSIVVTYGRRYELIPSLQDVGPSKKSIARKEAADELSVDQYGHTAAALALRDDS
jgi:predicted PurR-regulated permease PerM